MYNNKLILACAGAGKTEFIVNNALSKCTDKKVLITTYTNANEEEIKNRIISKKGCIPSNITVQSWWSFLLQHGVKPYQNYILKKDVEGLLLVNSKSGHRNSQVYWGKNNPEKYYLSENKKIYSDKIAVFVYEANTDGDNKDCVINRLQGIYDNIYIDEVQDLVGYDLEIIKMLFTSSINIILVGDTRQCTYQTHYATKHQKYVGKIHCFLKKELPKRPKVTFKYYTRILKKSYRCNADICNVANQVYGDSDCILMESSFNEENVHKGVFLIKVKDLESYLKEFTPIQLRTAKNTEGVNSAYDAINFGQSKGLSFDRVVIFPTNNIKKWIKGDEYKDAKLYVALTRAKHSVALVYNYSDNESYRDGLICYDPR